MTELNEVDLPGVGVRYEFVTEQGQRVGVVAHRSGRRDVYVADPAGDLSFAFMDLPVFDRFSGLSTTHFHELSAKTRIPVELLMLVREAIGFAQPTPDEQVRDDELLIVPAIELQLARGLRTTTIERWLQVYGDSLRRIAETEADWWRAEVELPLIESGIGEGEVLTEASRWGAQFSPLHDQAIRAILHGHEEHAWLKNIIQNVENALEEAGLRSRAAQGPGDRFLGHHGVHEADGGARRRGRGRTIGATLSCGAAHLSAARRQASEMARRRRHVLLLGACSRGNWRRWRWSSAWLVPTFRPPTSACTRGPLFPKMVTTSDGP